MEAQWKFRVMSRGEMNADPIEGEFFSTAHLDSITDALVRETIQNSLDAGVPGRSVFVRFRLARDRSPSNALFQRYFSTLIPHLEAEQTGLAFKPRPDEHFTFLAVEDYGTRGLTGDYTQDDDLLEGARKNDFFYFWRNVGRSGKAEEDRGRWGLGKTVFQACSRINSFVGVTVRSGDGPALLMGQSVLKTHLVDGKKHYPYGWYGIFDGDFPLPVADQRMIGRWCEEFGVDRVGKPGLSIVVPYPDSTIHHRGIIASVLVHYFFPIIAGYLAVEVDFGGTTYTIDKETIDGHISLINFQRTRYKPEHLRSLFGLARWAIALTEGEYVGVNLPDPKKAPEWNASLFDEGVLDGLRRKFEAGQKIALRIPITIQPKHSRAQTASFSVFLERDETLDAAEDHFIREGITIAGVKSLRQRGARVIVSAEERALSTMLGDAENPAHTEWQERSPKFRGKYERGASCLRFVKNSPREIVAILSAPSKGKDETLLRDIFYVDMPAERESPARGPETTARPGLEPGGRPEIRGAGQGRHFAIVPVRGGFRASGTGASDTPPKFFLLRAAYLIRRGDPFARYSPFDFELDKPPIRVRAMSVRVLQLERNQMVVETQGADFVVEVTGFDVHRDLIVKTEIITGGAG